MYSATIIVVTITMLAGCLSYDKISQLIAKRITSHRMKIVQGVFFSQDKISQLHVGMTKEEVLSLLSTPILSDIFNLDRWDYLFYFNCGSTQVIKKRDLVINFFKDHLVKFSITDDIPSDFNPL
ncbi:MAG: outer membrane protein assembly factor BamE [Burkholderia sp.]|nr:outer membrane protein assembly factor BamE [Burkholderia sp.]